MSNKKVKNIVPVEVINDINIKADVIFEDDQVDEKKEYIKSEMMSYIKFVSFDTKYKGFPVIKSELVEYYKETDCCYELWETVYKDIDSAMKDFEAFYKHKDDSISHDLIVKWKEEILEDYCGDLFNKLDERIYNYKKILEIRREVSPYKSLLIELENILGNEFYNNIQSYSSCDDHFLKKQGYRYPITIDDGEYVDKVKYISSLTNEENMINASYELGVNRLEIFRALLKMIKHLESKYELDLKNQ